MELSYEWLLESIATFFTEQFYLLPEEYQIGLNIFFLIVAFLAACGLLFIVLKKLWSFIRSVLQQRQVKAGYRLQFPGAYSWGNLLMRLPLMLIGTDMFCFAQLSQKGKLLRYIKSASVLIPTLWSVFGLVVFMASTGHEYKPEELYLAALPVLLVGSTIFFLDLSIISAGGTIKAKSIRFFLAMVTGYIFSSVPLNYYFNADISSYMLKHDDQVAAVESSYGKRIAAIEQAGWYKQYYSLLQQEEALRQDLMNERKGIDGAGLSGKPNSTNPTLNVHYNAIEAELQQLQQARADYVRQYQPKLDELQQLMKLKSEKVTAISKNNEGSHIKRHHALWEYALSSTSTALFFLAVMILFWAIDSLSILCSYIDESEYNVLCQERNEEMRAFFGSRAVREKFNPVQTSELR